VSQLDNALSEFDDWWLRHLTQLQRRIRIQQLRERQDDVHCHVVFTVSCYVCLTLVILIVNSRKLTINGLIYQLMV